MACAERLEALVADRNNRQKQFRHCRIALLTTADPGADAIRREAWAVKTAVWRRQKRFANAGADSTRRPVAEPAAEPLSGGAGLVLTRARLEEIW